MYSAFCAFAKMRLAFSQELPIMARAFDFDKKYIDIHCHILPGVDDGSRDTLMSLQMARIAVENNIGAIVVTPHYDSAHRSVSPDGIRRRVDELQQTLANEGIELLLYPGNELLYDSSLPGKLTGGEVLTLADSTYCLVEFHPLEDYKYIFNGLRSLIYEGFRPILAHCERYACLIKDPKRVDEIVSQRVLLQCNSGSVEPRLFRSVPRFVNSLLRRKLVSFIATDAHRAEGVRAPHLLRAAALLQKKYDEGYVRDLLADNARRVIDSAEHR